MVMLTQLLAERNRLAAASATAIEAMLEIDDRVRDIWRAVAADIRAGDVGAAIRKLAAIAEDSARARDLAEHAAQSVFVLVTIDGKIARDSKANVA